MKKAKKVFGNLVDIIHETIYPARVEIEEGKIIGIHRIANAGDHYLIPGFIDAHIHIESSMIPPSEFARFSIPFGVLATISDPHEMGNVLGVAGVEYMLQNASTVPFKFFFGAPSCVPATHFETAGACLGPKEIEYLLSKKEIKYLTEVMNIPEVIHQKPEMMAKMAIAKKMKKKIDGHAPQIATEDLKKYIASGIDTDHECISLEEAREKIALGMKILIREGSAAADFQALFPLLLESPEHCMLCSDDIDPETLLQGGVNLLVKRGVEKGVDVMKMLRCASLNPIEHYHLEMGVLRIGDAADFIEVNNLRDFEVIRAHVDGTCVFKDHQMMFPRVIPKIINHFKAHPKKEEDFQVSVNKKYIRVIEALDRQIVTGSCYITPLLEGNKAIADPSRDILKITVVNRYENKPPSVAFVKNFGLKKGAMASSVAHDSHNIIAVGTSDAYLCKAINCIIAHQGGLCVVDDQEEHCLPLAIGGLMSQLEGDVVAQQYKSLKEVATSLGCQLHAPFMTLSFMTLLVIPQLKISDLGLFDGESFQFVSLDTSTRSS